LDAKGRQRRFKNRVVFAYVMLLLIPLFVGIAETTIHGGLGFFIFRNADAGAGNSTDKTDEQFLHPSAKQADDNGAQQGKPTPAPTPTKTN
jgi:hypothetical protein